jgi:butyrate kinase
MESRMTEKEIIVAVNPGSTSTKMAIFEGESEVSREVIVHDVATLSRFSTIWDQYPLRLQAVKKWTLRFSKDPSAIVGVGGLLRSLDSGTYRVNETMLRDARKNVQGEHASNLGCAIAYELALHYKCLAFVVDPVSIDELEPVARYSGHPLIQRRSLSHALNLHASGRRAARELGVPYNESSLIVAHLGGGISIAPIRCGRMIDVNDASSDGPFSPERSGGLPLQSFISLCFSPGQSESDMRALVMGRGGLQAYLGTHSLPGIEERIVGGDRQSLEVFEAMAYQIAKEIGAMATVLAGKVDAVVLTGGMASSSRLIEAIGKRIAFLGRIIVYPGEDEMRAMALGALRALRNEEQAKDY